MQNPMSKLVRVKLSGSRETETLLAECAETAIYADHGGECYLEVFRLSELGKPLESFRLHLCPEDRERLRKLV